MTALTSSPSKVATNRPKMRRLTAWFEGIGESLSGMGNPVSESTRLGSTGEGAQPGGYCFVKADHLESAVAIAKGCPVLGIGGGVEVGEVTALHPESVSSRQE